MRGSRLGVGLAALLALRCVAGPSAEPSGEPPAARTGRSWTDPVNFSALREEYGNREDFSAICESDRPLRQMYDASNVADWKTVLDLSKRWLDSCPVDIDAHLLRGLALRVTGKTAESDAHLRWFRGLMGSILQTGDGKSSDSPFVVISVGEEYSVLRVFRLHPTGQRLLPGGIDAITAVDGKGNESTVYFLPAAHWRRLEKSLEGVKRPE